MPNYLLTRILKCVLKIYSILFNTFVVDFVYKYSIIISSIKCNFKFIVNIFTRDWFLSIRILRNILFKGFIWFQWNQIYYYSINLWLLPFWNSNSQFSLSRLFYFSGEQNVYMILYLEAQIVADTFDIK